MKIVYLKDALNPDSYLELVSFAFGEDIGIKIQSNSNNKHLIERYDDEVDSEMLMLVIDGLLYRLDRNHRHNRERLNLFTKHYVNNIRFID